MHARVRVVASLDSWKSQQDSCFIKLAWATPLLRKARECSFLRLEWTGGFVATKWSVYPMKWHVYTHTHMYYMYMYMYMRALVVSVWQNTHGAHTEHKQNLSDHDSKFFLFFFSLQMFSD